VATPSGHTKWAKEDNTVATSKTILLADADDNDLFFCQYALEQAGMGENVVVAHVGQEVIDYLGSTISTNHRAPVAPRPALLLLDLKILRCDAFAVLSWIKQNPALKEMPVIIFSDLTAPEEIERARTLGAKDYFCKPHALAAYSTILREILSRWAQ